MNTKILLLSVLLSNQASAAEFLMPRTTADGKTICHLIGDLVEAHTVRGRAMASIGFTCLQKDTGVIGAESVIVDCDTGQVHTTEAIRSAPGGGFDRLVPEQRSGILAGSILHEYAEAACGYARTQKPKFATGLGKRP